MIAINLPLLDTFAAWRTQARALLQAGVKPHRVAWTFEGAADDLVLPLSTAATDVASLPHVHRAPPLVPTQFLDIAGDVACHDDPERFSRLYEVLCRLQGEPGLLVQRFDPGISRLFEMQAQVHRDAHKMKAFVRFREISGDAERRCFAAWFEPQHFIVEKTAPFFARRFADMDWVIATPALTACFRGGNLSFIKTVSPPERLADATESLWRVYFSSIFNPARLKIAAMKREMPVRYWKNLPEAAIIPQLIAEAPRRAEAMREAPPTEPPLFSRKAVAPMITSDLFAEDSGPDAHGGEKALHPSLEAMHGAARSCTRCPLFAHATQTVFGEGQPDARLVFVGEQPGDKEDLAGRPFVGPAGKLFDACLAEAEISREECYITNAVKHFKFESRGKVRLHKRPNAAEIAACRWWLDGELALLKPELVVALGATAAQALTGSGEAILKRRGNIEETTNGLHVFITVHPSSLLRMPTPELVQQGRRQFVEDLKAIRSRLT